MYHKIYETFHQRCTNIDIKISDFITIINSINNISWIPIRECLQIYLNQSTTTKLKYQSDPTFLNYIQNINYYLFNYIQTSQLTSLENLNKYTTLLTYTFTSENSALSTIRINKNGFLLPGSCLVGTFNTDNSLNINEFPSYRNIYLIDKEIDIFNNEILPYNYIHETNNNNEWGKLIDKSIDLILENDICSQLINTFLKFIFPLRNNNQILNVDFSFSSINLPYVVYKNKEDQDFLFGESLVHESDHHFFYALEELNNFWHSHSDANLATFYSPWRNDSRPLIGVLRGLSAFTRICIYYETLLSKKLTSDLNSVGQLLTFKLLQCKEATSTLLSSGALNSSGINLVLEIDSINNDIFSCLNKNMSFNDWATNSTQKLIQHKKQWENNNNQHLPT